MKLSPLQRRLKAFGDAMAVAEKHRQVLHSVGLTDRQIGMAVLATRPKTSRNPIARYAKSLTRAHHGAQ
jgi:hypothetical protein